MPTSDFHIHVYIPIHTDKNTCACTPVPMSTPIHMQNSQAALCGKQVSETGKQKVPLLVQPIICTILNSLMRLFRCHPRHLVPPEFLSKLCEWAMQASLLHLVRQWSGVGSFRQRHSGFEKQISSLVVWTSLLLNGLREENCWSLGVLGNTDPVSKELLKSSPLIECRYLSCERQCQSWRVEMCREFWPTMMRH